MSPILIALAILACLAASILGFFLRVGLKVIGFLIVVALVIVAIIANLLGLTALVP